MKVCDIAFDQRNLGMVQNMQWKLPHFLVFGRYVRSEYDIDDIRAGARVMRMSGSYHLS